MGNQELILECEQKVLGIFNNKYNKIVFNLDVGIIIQVILDGEYHTFVNDYSIKNFGTFDKKVAISDNCYKVDFINSIYNPTLKLHGEEFIIECFNDYFTFLKSKDKDKFKVTFPFFNKTRNETTWLVVNGFVIERNDEGLPLMTGAMFYEIDEQKELKEKLKIQNSLLEQQIQNFKNAEEVGNLGSYLVDLDANNEEYWVSDNYTKMLGITDKSNQCYTFTDRRIWINEHIIDDKNEMYSKFNKFLYGDEQTYEHTYRANINGTIKWLQTKTNALKRNQNGEVTKYIGTVKDVTEIKENELKLYKAMKVAEKDNDAKTSFIAHISHEIRTPLNAIIGYTNLISNVKQIKKIREYSQKINYSAKILLSLINDVLDLSKITSNNLDLEYIDFDFKRELTQLVESFKIFVDEKDLELVYFIDKNIPNIVNGDLLKIKQILSNLLNNSIKFTNEGYVSLKVYFESKGDKNKLTFEVADTGIGIKEEQLNNLFQPFTQADNSTTRKYGGTGLGLTICKELIDLMKGKIRVSSKVNYGTTFNFEIPINIVDTQDEYGIIEYNNIDRTDKRILIVEDNEVNSLLIEELLKANQLYNIKISENGEEAIEQLEEEDFDIILMDIQMPVLDGIETTKYIRSKYPDKKVKIIALTANVLKEQIDEYMSVGFDDYISKPVDLNILLNKIYN